MRAHVLSRLRVLACVTCKPEPVRTSRQQASTLSPWPPLQAGLEQRLANAKKKASQMEKLLPRQVISEDQREVLRLLCRAHELEVENTELQADSLRSKHLLCEKDFVIQRCHQHRLLCEQIIQDQRRLIQGEPRPAPGPAQHRRPRPPCSRLRPHRTPRPGPAALILMGVIFWKE